MESRMTDDERKEWAMLSKATTEEKRVWLRRQNTRRNSRGAALLDEEAGYDMAPQRSQPQLKEQPERPRGEGIGVRY
jgi:hypothetical protein